MAPPSDVRSASDVCLRHDGGTHHITAAKGGYITAASAATSLRRQPQHHLRIARGWSGDLEPTELLIEAFGLGRYVGAHGAGPELCVPLDIFTAMEKRCGVPAQKLAKAYVKGALDAVKERKK